MGRSQRKLQTPGLERDWLLQHCSQSVFQQRAAAVKKVVSAASAVEADLIMNELDLLAALRTGQQAVATYASCWTRQVTSRFKESLFSDADCLDPVIIAEHLSPAETAEAKVKARLELRRQFRSLAVRFHSLPASLSALPEFVCDPWAAQGHFHLEAAEQQYADLLETFPAEPHVSGAWLEWWLRLDAHVASRSR